MGGIVQSGTLATPRLDLGAAFMEYIATAENFVGLRAVPVFKSMKNAANFPAITRESIMRRADAKRAPNGKYNRDGFETKDVPFNCQEYGLEGLVDDAKRNLYKSDFDAEFVQTRIVGNRILLEQEFRVKELLINTTTFTGTALYKDYNATPWTTVGTDVRSQINFGKGKVRLNCGLLPNALIITTNNLDALKVNTGVQDSIKYVKELSDEELAKSLAAFFGVKNVLVAKSAYNSAKEGQVFTGADVWDDNYAFLGVISEDETGDLTDPAVGRTILWAEDSPDNAVVETYRDEEARGDVVRVRHNVDELLIDKYFGFLLKVR